MYNSLLCIKSTRSDLNLFKSFVERIQLCLPNLLPDNKLIVMVSEDMLLIFKLTLKTCNFHGDMNSSKFRKYLIGKLIWGLQKTQCWFTPQCNNSVTYNVTTVLHILKLLFKHKCTKPQFYQTKERPCKILSYYKGINH